MKRVLVTGSESYIGTVLVDYLAKKGFDVTGMDTGLISDCLLFPTNATRTIYKDTRDITEKDLTGFDAVVYLAGISNDPFASFDPKKIYDPVRKHTVRTAKLCKKLGIKFIFSSSCSIYGKGTDALMNEDSQVYPQTPYSINKLQIEQDLTKMSDDSFKPVLLRFATVFGLSPRMRFDLVVNMFTAMAFTKRQIVLNSNGQAWRPLVHIRDVCKAIALSINYDVRGKKPLVLNVGSSSQNFKIIDLARMTSKIIKGTEVNFLNQTKSSEVNELIKDRKIQDGVDSRDYKISFEKINKIFPSFKCDFPVEKGIKEMYGKFEEIRLSKEDFENINYYRLQKIESLIKQGLLTGDLRWIKKPERHLTPELYTKRLHLRIFTEKDVSKQYVKALNNKSIIGLTESRYRTWTEQEVKDYIREKGNVPWESLLIGIFKSGKNEKHIGNIRLHSFSKHNRRVELGILIWDKTMWGKGYASEAITAVCDYVFKALNLSKICAEYYSTNKASEKIFRKLKFNKEGVFKNHFIVDGNFVDAVRVAKYNQVTK
jgi:nucleoside-diphosphate-sugar epimerase/RimJ/RimL family protein N-acetyltransferase